MGRLACPVTNRLMFTEPASVQRRRYAYYRIVTFSHQQYLAIDEAAVLTVACTVAIEAGLSPGRRSLLALPRRSAHLIQSNLSQMSAHCVALTLADAYCQLD